MNGAARHTSPKKSNTALQRKTAMPHESQLTVGVHLAWWVQAYLIALIAFATITGLEPDADKAADLISRRGLRFTTR